MKRREFLRSAAVMAAATGLVGNRVAEASQTMTVQVRVYRQPRPGIFQFLPDVRVQLSNGMTGVTSNRPGVRGTVHFQRLPKKDYSARAFVAGRWYGPTSFQRNRPSDPPWRINIQVP
jgi:hypothetical protein